MSAGLDFHLAGFRLQGSCNKKMACMIAQLGRFPKLLLGLHDPHNIRHAAGHMDVNEYTFKICMQTLRQTAMRA